jgi:hypothetical protein
LICVLNKRPNKYRSATAAFARLKMAAFVSVGGRSYPQLLEQPFVPMVCEANNYPGENADTPFAHLMPKGICQIYIFVCQGVVKCAHLGPVWRREILGKT